MTRPTLDIITRAVSMLRSAGLTNVARRLPSGSDEAVVVSLAISPNPTHDYVGGRESDYRISVIVKRESEEQAISEAFEIADLLDSSSLDSANGSYRWISTEVGTPRSINWDEAGFYVWSVEATAYTSRKD